MGNITAEWTATYLLQRVAQVQPFLRKKAPMPQTIRLIRAKSSIVFYSPQMTCPPNLQTEVGTQQLCFQSSIIICAARRPISTAKLVPRSQGYTWLMLAKYNPGKGVRIEGILRE